MAENEISQDPTQSPDLSDLGLTADAENILSSLSLGNQIVNNNAQQQNFINHQQAMNQLNLVTLAKSIAMIGSVPNDTGNLGNMQDMLQLLRQQVGSMNTSTVPESPAGAADPAETEAAGPTQLRMEITRLRNELNALEKRIPTK